MAKQHAPDARGAHLRLYWDIVDSNAWRCLSASDQRAYIALARQLKSTNNGDLSLPLSFARQFGVASSATLAKSLRALVAVGLLAITRKGGCARGGQRLPTLYRFTDYVTYENPKKLIDSAKATNEWKAVKTLVQGAALIRIAEANAAKTQLQKLAITASKNEVVSHLTASKNEAWAPIHDSKIEGGEMQVTGRKANGSKGFAVSAEVVDSENHTSINEVLLHVATHTGNPCTVTGTEAMHA